MNTNEYTGFEEMYHEERDRAERLFKDICDLNRDITTLQTESRMERITYEEKINTLNCEIVALEKKCIELEKEIEIGKLYQKKVDLPPFMGVQ